MSPFILNKCNIYHLSPPFSSIPLSPLPSPPLPLLIFPSPNLPSLPPSSPLSQSAPHRNNSSFGSFLLMMASSLFENIWGIKKRFICIIIFHIYRKPANIPDDQHVASIKVISCRWKKCFKCHCFQVQWDYSRSVEQKLPQRNPHTPSSVMQHSTACTNACDSD